MKKAVLIGVPHHNNLGDHAIVLAEREYIEDNFKEYQYYEVSEETAEKCLEKVKKHIHPEDILFLHGGGNLGDEYLYVEEARRKVVQLFPNNIIIFFPQTMHFSNTEKGKRELNKSREIYANHKKLVMVAREEVSYQTMKKEFYENNVIKTPDIVTYLNKNEIDLLSFLAKRYIKDVRELLTVSEENDTADELVNKELTYDYREDV